MPRRTVFLPYQPKTILNKGQRADHWFWTCYSAYPYTGLPARLRVLLLPRAQVLSAR